MEQVSIDLVDMRSQQDGCMKWILHIKGHFSKYTTLYVMPNKKASTVAKYIYMFILHCGIPDIIQCDNATEFKSMMIVFVVQDDMKLINGYQICSHYSHGLIWHQND